MDVDPNIPSHGFIRDMALCELSFIILGLLFFKQWVKVAESDTREAGWAKIGLFLTVFFLLHHLIAYPVLSARVACLSVFFALYNYHCQIKEVYFPRKKTVIQDVPADNSPFRKLTPEERQQAHQDVQAYLAVNAEQEV